MNIYFDQVQPVCECKCLRKGTPGSFCTNMRRYIRICSRRNSARLEYMFYWTHFRAKVIGYQLPITVKQSSGRMKIRGNPCVLMLQNNLYFQKFLCTKRFPCSSGIPHSLLRWTFYLFDESTNRNVPIIRISEYPITYSYAEPK